MCPYRIRFYVYGLYWNRRRDYYAGNATNEKPKTGHVPPHSPRYTGTPYTTGAAPFRYRK
jgi:hypothetical protein